VTLATSKRFRAALALTCARAVELPPRVALEIGVAVELLHTFSLVHDDIEDGAETRRGHPAVHVVDGVPVAINAGDALHALAWTTVLAVDAPPKRTLDVAKMFSYTLDRMVAGQARDLIWTRDHRSDISFDDYIDMVRGKTGALLGFAAAAPAELLGHEGAGRLYMFGEELGIALQLLDDVAGVRGDPNVLGKPVGPETNGVASAPALLASWCDDGTERAIELARRRIDLACEHLDAAGVTEPMEIQLFAETMLARLLANTRSDRIGAPSVMRT
jgi:geranylgeranyl diphosphate synthase type I